MCVYVRACLRICLSLFTRPSYHRTDAKEEFFVQLFGQIVDMCEQLASLRAPLYDSLQRLYSRVSNVSGAA
jgi:hypothetical protein